MKLIIAISLLFALFSCAGEKSATDPTQTTQQPKTIPVLEKIAGVSLEMPSDSIPPTSMNEIVQVGGKWVALIPYAMTREGGSKVEYDTYSGWWGETAAGTTACIQMAHAKGLKTMMKPHVWVIGQGWPGRFDLKTEKEWLEWEESYRAYILTFAKISEEHKVDLFCIGTEYRIAVVKRPKFWKKLIQEVREIYKGKVTYAENFDNYQRVTFWDDLDIIGIDAYFSLSKKKEPTVEELTYGWKKRGEQLKAFSKKWNRKILFTEYGFQSCDYFNAHSVPKKSKLTPNMGNQERAYQAFFQSIWQEDWMLGGFFWKWHFSPNAGGLSDHDYTPQNKPAMKVIEAYYKAVKTQK